MAIRCNNIDAVSTQAEAVVNFIGTDGKALINACSTTIENLKVHWKGTDAVANLADLAKVYNSLTTMMINLQKLIVDVNNNEILALQKAVSASGGSNRVGSELSASLAGTATSIQVPTDGSETWTDNAILQDASDFSSFPTKFQTFITNFTSKTDELFRNWTEGAGVENIVSTVNNFKNSAEQEYKPTLDKVANNLNIVAENKKALL